MSEPTTDAQLDEFLEIRKPGAHLEEDVVADDFVLMLGVDLVNYPEVPPGRRRRHLSRRPTSTSASSSTSTPAPSSPTTAGRTAPTCASPTSRRRRSPPSSCRGASAYLQLCVDGWAAEVAKRYGAETMAEIEWAAWNDQVVPELERMTAEFLPAGTVYDDPNQQVAEADRADDPRRLHRAVHAAARHRRALQGAAGHLVPRAATSTCCSASRRGRRRSSCATGSTRCSTSSARCGATRCCPA